MTSWWDVLKQLTAMTLCATIIDLALPTGSMRRYARLVSGLIMMYLMLRPMSALLTGSMPVIGLMETLTSTGAAP